VVIAQGGWGRFLKYAASSAAATLCSAVTFALAYRILHVGPQVASITAFAAGAVVNFTGSRYWAWGARTRNRLRRDVVLYACLAVATALAAAGVTSVAEAYTTRLGVSADQQAILVEAAYFATYAAMFLVKFVLLDRVLFAARPLRSRHQVDSTTRA
jgi:putative flippase GtrA